MSKNSSQTGNPHATRCRSGRDTNSNMVANPNMTSQSVDGPRLQPGTPGKKMDRSNYGMKTAKTTAKKQSTMKRGLGGSYSQETKENGDLTWVRNGLKESQVKIEEIDQDNPPAEQSDDMKHMEEDGGGAWGDEMGGTQQARLLAEFHF